MTGFHVPILSSNGNLIKLLWVSCYGWMEASDCTIPLILASVANFGPPTRGSLSNRSYLNDTTDYSVHIFPQKYANLICLAMQSYEFDSKNFVLAASNLSVKPLQLAGFPGTVTKPVPKDVLDALSEGDRHRKKDTQHHASSKGHKSNRNDDTFNLGTCSLSLLQKILFSIST